MRFAHDDLSLEQTLGTLRALYFKHPQNSTLARALIAALFDNRDAAGAHTILRHYLEVNGEVKAAWVSSSEGLLAALSENPRQAALFFGQAIAFEERFEHRYNRAICLMAADSLREAEQDLLQADKLLRLRQHTARARAAVAIRLAELYWRQGDASRAWEALENCLHDDPTNADAFRLRRKLEKGDAYRE
jgi:predicted Zn-dependent protease